MPVVLKEGDIELALDLPRVSHRELERFARAHPDLRLERTAEGKLIVMPPTDAYTDSRNAELVTEIALWNRTQTPEGLVFGPSAGFTLPDGATRSPDAAWLPQAAWDALTPAQRKTFAQVVPELVVEVMSPSDSLTQAQEKMEEFRQSGARLGLLIDRKRRTVHLYRPGQPTATLVEPAAVSCEPEFPGLVLPMERIFGS